MRDLLDVLTRQDERPVAFTRGVLIAGGLTEDGSFYVREGSTGRFGPRRIVLDRPGLGFVTDPEAGTVVRIVSQEGGLESEEISLTASRPVGRGRWAMPGGGSLEIIDLVL